jgi:hypothetical protein
VTTPAQLFNFRCLARAGVSSLLLRKSPVREVNCSINKLCTNSVNRRGKMDEAVNEGFTPPRHYPFVSEQPDVHMASRYAYRCRLQAWSESDRAL